MSILLFLAACTSSDDGNPIAGDRHAEGVVTFAGHDVLDGHAFESSTPAGNRTSSAPFRFQLAFSSDETDPVVALAFTLDDPSGPVAPGEFPVQQAVDDEDPVATLIFTAGSNADAWSVTGMGATGTFVLDELEDGRASGSFDLTGDATWNAGTGTNVFTVEGTFSDVPITAL